jgi:hypothetical protein
MVLPGTQIQRDEHGRCGLLPNRTLSSNKAELPSSGVLPHTGINLHNVRPLVVTSDREAQSWSDGQDRKPFHVTRARCRVEAILISTPSSARASPDPSPERCTQKLSFG